MNSISSLEFNKIELNSENSKTQNENTLEENQSIFIIMKLNNPGNEKKSNF